MLTHLLALLLYSSSALIIIMMVAASAASASANLIQVDMHPSTSYIQWLLHQQQSIIDGDLNNNSHRRRRKLKIIEEQLQRAMEHIEGTSAVYAPFFEFPLLLTEDDALIYNDNLHHDNTNDNDDHNHRRLIKQYMQRHNDAVLEYNERYRQYSRYERALQNEQSSSSFDNMNTTIITATATTRLDTQSSILTSLHGTKWQATELFIASNNSNKATNNYQLQAPLANHHPITIEFDANDDDNNGKPQKYIITGSISECNRYMGSIHQTVDPTTLNNSFYIGDIVATAANTTVTDAICTTAVASSVIEQEQSYMKLLSNRQVYVEVVMNNNATADELVFWNYDSVAVKNDHVRLQQQQEEVLTHYHRHGQILTRFKPLSDSLLKGSDQLSTSSVHRRRTIQQRSLQETVTSKKKGGMFNSYQTSPLHQGYGTHYATIWVGTPPQRKSVIIDTGSHFTAFPCKGCLGCGEEHHTDKYFDQDASSTFRPLHCKAVPNRPKKECQGAANCLNGKCILSQTYTEGSSWEAFQAVDKLFVGGKQLTNTALSGDSYVADFVFGCQTKETGLFVTQLADGIMGMSAHPATLPQVLYEQGKIEHNMFSLCVRRELHVSKQGVEAGRLTFGGIDSRSDTTPMVYARNVAKHGWFTVFVKNIYIREKGGQSAKADGKHQAVQKVNVDLYQMNSGKGVIVDSGTTDTYLHKSVAEPFDEVWRKVTGVAYSNIPLRMAKKDLLLLPTVLVQLSAYEDGPDPASARNFDSVIGLAADLDPTSPQDVLVAIPATHYMEYSPSKGTYTPRIYFTETQGGVIGSNSMQGHHVLFDWENKRVGFAESSCEFQDTQTSDKGDVYSDCQLGAPSLTVSCSDSADLSDCDNNKNANKVMKGVEVWTRIVQSPGLYQGLTCEQVSASENEANGGGKMDVQCDGKGICREVRDCVITCSNAIALGSTGNEPAPGNDAGSCGGGTWSACDYTCSQTRINSVLMNDGRCHEEKALEFTRPCHVQACGRDDPCRVPFVVHAILKMRGVVASRWNKQAGELFADAFASAVNGNRKSNELLFEPGDVNILSASPWRASDDSIFGETAVEGEEKELGMQFVVEASIFNFNVELPQVVEQAGKGIPLVATCKDSDLHPLAETALQVHKELGRANFIVSLVKAMKKDVSQQIGQGNRVSAFTYIFEDDANLAQQSKVVTSWTIKTDIKGTPFTASNTSSVVGIFRFVIIILLAGAISLYIALKKKHVPKKKKKTQESRRKSSGSSRKRNATRRSNRGMGPNLNTNDDDDLELQSLISTSRAR